MINISKISNATFIGRLLRLPLKLIPKNKVIRIFQGANKGLGWVRGSGNNSYWLGTYEIDKQQAIKNSLRKGMVFYDIGAHAGFFTLLAARLVGNEGLVVAFEPLSTNIYYLRRNIAANNLKNVMIKEGVVAKQSGNLYFRKGDSNAGGHISHSGITVRAYSIDELVESGLRKPNVVKIDVQGATFLVLQGMINALKNNNMKLFIAIDNAPRAGLVHFSKKDVHEFLNSVGYKTAGINGEEILENVIEEINEIIAYRP